MNYINMTGAPPYLSIWMTPQPAMLSVIRKTVKTGINDMKVFKLKSHVVLKELEEKVHG